MTTDREHAAVLRLIVTDRWVTSEQGVAAIERAIVVLEAPVIESVEEWMPDYRAQRDEALAEVERLRTALFGDVAEYVILTPENFKTLVAKMEAWRALAVALEVQHRFPPGSHVVKNQSGIWRC